jgi:hypothetical protein
MTALGMGVVQMIHLGVRSCLLPSLGFGGEAKGKT